MFDKYVSIWLLGALLLSLRVLVEFLAKCKEVLNFGVREIQHLFCVFLPVRFSPFEGRQTIPTAYRGILTPRFLAMRWAFS